MRSLRSLILIFGIAASGCVSFIVVFGILAAVIQLFDKSIIQSYTFTLTDILVFLLGFFLYQISFFRIYKKSYRRRKRINRTFASSFF